MTRGEARAASGYTGTGERPPAIAGELEQLMRDMDERYFCTDDRPTADAFWDGYLAPEVDRLFDPDAVFHSHFEGPGGRSVYHGLDGLRQWSDDVVDVFTEFRRESEEWTVVADGVLMLRQRIRAVGRENGAVIEIRAWAVWSVKDGRVVELRGFADAHEAAAAAAAVAAEASPAP